MILKVLLLMPCDRQRRGRLGLCHMWHLINIICPMLLVAAMGIWTSLHKATVSLSILKPFIIYISIVAGGRDATVSRRMVEVHDGVGWGLLGYGGTAAT